MPVAGKAPPKMKPSMTKCVRSTILLAVAVLPRAPILADEPKSSYPPTMTLEGIQECVNAASKQHPRLLASADDFAALRSQLKQDPMRTALADTVVREATLLEQVPPVEPRL